VIERVIENWLDSTTEREYESAFCQVLIALGHRIIHRSKHGPTELGKDLISMDRDGIVHAYQLKTGTIDLAKWRDIREEVQQLVELPIQHPNIPVGTPFRPCLVTNGSISEPVRLDINARNAAWDQRRYPSLELILRDDLLRRFLDLQGRFLPSAPADFEKFLHLYLGDKRDFLDKQEFAEFLESFLPFKEEVKRGEIRRLFGATAILANYILSRFQSAGNHLATAEGWMLVLAHLLKIAERARLYERVWLPCLEIIVSSWEGAVAELTGEALRSPNWMEGDRAVDFPFVGARNTVLLGYLSGYALYKRLTGGKHEQEDDILFRVSSGVQPEVWGESATPFLFATVLLLWLRGMEGHAVAMAAQVVKLISRMNQHEQGQGIPDPYYDVVSLMNYAATGKEIFGPRQSFTGSSYSLRVFVEFLARRWRKQSLKRLWYDITEVDHVEFTPEDKTDYYLWRTKRGTLTTRRWRRPETWDNLLADATAVPDSGLLIFDTFRAVLLPFLLVYPHRMTPSAARLVEASVLRAI
jgi:hypothetical protein